MILTEEKLVQFYDGLAERIHDTMFEAHRGIIAASDERLIVFGNDGYSSDKRTREQVELLRGWLVGEGQREEFFGTNTHGYSWVLGVSLRPGLKGEFAPDGYAGMVENALWRCWAYSRGLEPSAAYDVQRAIAEGVTSRAFTLLGLGKKHPPKPASA